MFSEFRKFVSRGNVLDMAIGIIIGAAFGNIVQSLVNDILMPPVGLLLKGIDFKDLFYALNGQHYASAQAAQQAGAPAVYYGVFINNVLNFFIVAFVIFLLVKAINNLQRPPEPGTPAAPQSKECPYCKTQIPLAAVRCPNCTSDIQGA